MKVFFIFLVIKNIIHSDFPKKNLVKHKLKN